MLRKILRRRSSHAMDTLKKECGDNEECLNKKMTEMADRLLPKESPARKLGTDH